MSGIDKELEARKNINIMFSSLKAKLLFISENLQKVENVRLKLTRENKQLLEAVKLAYRKHHLNDQNIGWEELSDNLLAALCESMTDDGYQKWLCEVSK